MRWVALLTTIMFFAACGGVSQEVEPTPSPASTSSPSAEPTVTMTADAEAGAPEEITGLERQIIETVIDLNPRVCLNQEVALAAAEELLGWRESSERKLERAKNTIQVCKDKGLWLGD